jgi:hypothetical protein
MDSFSLNNYKNFVNENDFFNEICLNIQPLSNNTYVSMLTLSSPYLFIPIDYTFNVWKVSLIRWIMIESMWGYSSILWHLLNG